MTNEIPRMFPFGQMGWTPKLSQQGKLMERAKQVRDMGIADEKHIVIQTEQGKTGKFRNAEFHVIRKNFGQHAHYRKSVRVIQKKLSKIPTKFKLAPRPHTILHMKYSIQNIKSGL